MHLLCLSNGHGEDVIAVRILQELQKHPAVPELAALPLVGEGRAYTQLGIPIIGPVQKMPSGGFIYMEGRQLLRDVRGGLLQLTRSQFKAVRRWSKRGGTILAVGDIVPLLFAWSSGAPYAFVGTAKSEYYLRDEAGWLPNRSRREGWSGSVYLPWERWLMSRRRCKAVFPRDKLTTEILQKWPIPAFDLGNPMMDGIYPEHPTPIFYEPDAELKEMQRSLIITLLPGSRAPEAYENWQKIVVATSGFCDTFSDRSVLFLGAIAPGLNLDLLRETLQGQGWRQQASESTVSNLQLNDEDALTFTQKNATLILTQNDYNLCLLKSDCCIAMAGTATEQFVGLGKPAIAIPGNGPQFNPAFAEAQSRLLGPSLILVEQPEKVASVLQQLFRDPDWLQLIAENGYQRMGQPGAAQRIANCLMERLKVEG
ncbi:MAG: lipid-A-disaccharide synthase-related protein [Cyanobacteriota bacterium]